MQTLYLNNYGDKWIIEPRKVHHRFVLVLPDGTRKIRQADYFYAFGNFAGWSFRYKGKRTSGLPDSFADEQTGLPVIYLDYKTNPIYNYTRGQQ